VDINQEILNMDEAANYLRISRKHLGNILSGKVKGAPPLACVRAGRRTLIKRSALDEWFSAASQQRKPPTTFSALEVA
jgi:excisionase family DNA binding protein